jgi:hypothetical protein
VPKYRRNLWEGGVQDVTFLDSGRADAQKTFTCAHCNCVTVVPFKAKPDECGGFCMLEHKPVCGPCHKVGTCTPFEKKLEAMEARGRLLAAIG